MSKPLPLPQTKEERAVIYKGALSHIAENYGICYAISLYRHLSTGRRMTAVQLKDWPEVFSLRPADYDAYIYMYWFPLNAEGTEKRRQILLKAIELCKENSL